MKINQNAKFGSSYNTRIFKISPGFSSKLEPHNSLNLALCRENQNIDLFDHLYEAILCDSHYVFPALARGVSVPDFALADATSKWPEMSFLEFLKHYKYKWKSIKMFSFGRLLTPKYQKSAQVSHQH